MMKERAFFTSAIISLLMMPGSFLCPVSGGDVEPDDKKSSLSQPAAVAAHHDEAEGDSSIARGDALPFPKCLYPENLTLKEIFTFSFHEVMVLRGFTCVGEELLYAVSQGAGDMGQRGNLLTMTPFCP